MQMHTCLAEQVIFQRKVKQIISKRATAAKLLSVVLKSI